MSYFSVLVSFTPMREGWLDECVSFQTHSRIGIDLPGLPNRLTMAQNHGQHDDISKHTEDTEQLDESLETQTLANHPPS